MLFTVTLNRNADFQRLYRKGAFCGLGAALLYALPNRLPYNRLGITAGKKHLCGVGKGEIPCGRRPAPKAEG